MIDMQDIAGQKQALLRNREKLLGEQRQLQDALKASTEALLRLDGAEQLLDHFVRKAAEKQKAAKDAASGAEICVGDKVQLNSGGPEMRVEEVQGDNLVCGWAHADDGHWISEVFTRPCVHKVGAEV